MKQKHKLLSRAFAMLAAILLAFGSMAYGAFAETTIDVDTDDGAKIHIIVNGEDITAPETNADSNEAKTSSDESQEETETEETQPSTGDYLRDYGVPFSIIVDDDDLSVSDRLNREWPDEITLSDYVYKTHDTAITLRETKTSTGNDYTWIHIVTSETDQIGYDLPEAESGYEPVFAVTVSDNVQPGDRLDGNEIALYDTGRFESITPADGWDNLESKGARILWRSDYRLLHKNDYAAKVDDEPWIGVAIGSARPNDFYLLLSSEKDGRKPVTLSEIQSLFWENGCDYAAVFAGQFEPEYRTKEDFADKELNEGFQFVVYDVKGSYQPTH